MRDKTHNPTSWKFIIIIILLTAMSIAGIFAPERILWPQDSNILRWVLAILLSFILSWILFWLSIMAPDASMLATGGLDWQRIKSKGKGQFVQGIMVADLRRVLYFQPLIALVAGWILDWGINKIVGIISVLTFISIAASFFRAFKQWELNEKADKASMQT